MNTQISFKEMALRGKEILDKQGPVTLEQAREQVKRLKKNSKCNNMGMMFGGWAREEEERSDSDRARDEGFSIGLRSGHDGAITKAQLLISQDVKLSHEEKRRLWDELEKLRWK